MIDIHVDETRKHAPKLIFTMPHSKKGKSQATPMEIDDESEQAKQQKTKTTTPKKSVQTAQKVSSTPGEKSSDKKRKRTPDRTGSPNKKQKP